MQSGPVVEAVELDELLITVVVDNATDGLSSIPAGIPQHSEFVHLLDGPSVGTYDGHDMFAVFEQLCLACHGFSVLATGFRDEDVSTVLFDVGPSGELWLGNAARLGIDLSAIAVLFVSHWHGDHTGGIPIVVAAISEARRHAGLPPLIVDVHPDRPDWRGILTPLGKFAMLPKEPTFAEIEAAGGQITQRAEARAVAGGLFLSSGDVPRTTAYETGLAGHYSWREGHVDPDPEIHDERFLAAHVRGQGTTVFSACSHSGIVNVALEALRLLPDRPIDLLLGGYHLAGSAVEDRISSTVEDLGNLVEPRLVSPGHCTGWRAASALATAFGPSGYACCVVGSHFILTASRGALSEPASTHQKRVAPVSDASVVGAGPQRSAD
jgi:7,8-dihydropterin-6-yl-methyl-4-(beta-D-ribofuranosyl)aminobenzene 5'-phosphate synthase